MNKTFVLKDLAQVGLEMCVMLIASLSVHKEGDNSVNTKQKTK